MLATTLLVGIVTTPDHSCLATTSDSLNGVFLEILSPRDSSEASYDLPMVLLTCDCPDHYVPVRSSTNNASNSARDELHLKGAMDGRGEIRRMPRILALAVVSLPVFPLLCEDVDVLAVERDGQDRRYGEAVRIFAA